MAARQTSASFADCDASRSHRSMMTERDEGTDGQRLPQVGNINRAGFPGRIAARSRRIGPTHRVADDLSVRCVSPVAGIGTLTAISVRTSPRTVARRVAGAQRRGGRG